MIFLLERGSKITNWIIKNYTATGALIAAWDS